MAGFKLKEENTGESTKMEVAMVSVRNEILGRQLYPWAYSLVERVENRLHRSGCNHHVVHVFGVMGMLSST